MKSLLCCGQVGLQGECINSGQPESYSRIMWAEGGVCTECEQCEPRWKAAEGASPVRLLSTNLFRFIGQTLSFAMSSFHTWPFESFDRHPPDIYFKI